MRTRTSNRTKNYTPQKYDFESSSDSEPDNAAPSQKATARQRRRAVSSENSDDASAVSSPDDEDFSQEEEAPSSPASDDRPADTTTPIRRERVKKGKAPPKVKSRGYLEVESVTTDTPLKGYSGPYDRTMRGQPLINAWYGPRLENIRLAQRLLDRWAGWPVLPPKYTPPEKGLSDTAPWAGDFFKKEAQFAERWSTRKMTAADGFATPTTYTALFDDERRPYEQPRLGLRLLMGPLDVQKELVLHPGDSYSLSQSWLPYEDDTSEKKIPTGWILDAGGIVTGMDWCPKRDGVQLLALAVIPHSDQESFDYETEHQKPDFQKHGTVQVWACEGQQVGGVLRPSPQAPQLRKTVCLDFGRAKRVRWCPVPMSRGYSTIHYLAVLCGDGQVCIISNDEREDGSFDHILRGEASFKLENEASVKATAIAWATFNRLVVGYSDGSIALWSVYPQFMVSRHPVHHSLIVDIATGYPSQPFLVASTPIGGTTKLVDLSRPTYETTEVQTNAVSWQTNMLAYSDHSQGFFSVYPSANALNTLIGFMHQSFFPVVRRVFVGESYSSSLAVGRTHPFLLIGTTDGSLWCLNPQIELFHSRREATTRLRLFQHEHRPKELFTQDSPAAERGASRIIHGFAIEKGRSAKGEVRVPLSKKPKRPKKSDVDVAEGNEDDEVGGVMDPTRGIVYEPLSRITTVEWNPNEEYGCWAAAAMASGLVRVMDLGLDNSPG
ncbi:hypothetical protein QQS21_002816 [Conoideocrella luteorostrata]|uniref:WD40 repeat-like protein n=1 Tax=Conoideocrella luteorostrata TaxID=1105319 RepID=A0AAJ0CX69_9HYPO|nr:hypothetical protein QQS21_002816 [Conoideocrella luteorostrata]